MLLFVGLGNKGKEYAATRHNAGFMALDALRAKHAEDFGGWQKKFNAELCEGRLGMQKVILMKPQTFMNASGDAVAPAVGFWKLQPATDVCMVYDEIDIPLGNIRIRAEGSAGGHNGVKSVLAACGTQQVARVRIGIGSERSARVPSEDFVLETFANEEREVLEASLTNAVGAMETIATESLQAAQMKFGS